MKSTLRMLLLLLLSTTVAQAQGPPITGDKPIMLGGGATILKTLTEVRTTERGTFSYIPLIGHYLITSDALVGVHLPLVHYSFAENGNSGSNLGDIKLLGKYQFYRKDGMGKTFRLVAKTVQTLATGKKLGIEGMSMGAYQGYYGIVAGYESIKYGISNELGYNSSPNNEMDEFIYKLGFGLPLLKPVYPVKQLNLFFEYQASWFPELEDTAVLYAQGIQYAIGRITFETAVQVPLVKTPDERKYSLYFGTRFVF